MLEQRLIEQCAPTLAGIKSGNLLNYLFEEKEQVLLELVEVNKKLNARGVFVEALLWKEKSVLVYTYRYSRLEKDLQQEGVMELLLGYGYTNDKVNDCLEHLKTRLKESECFPHEIGVFLSYPLEDIKGFIKNKGKECKCCGTWKVYGNEQEAKQLFAKFKKCTEVYSQVFATGRSIAQMTVCA